MLMLRRTLRAAFSFRQRDMQRHEHFAEARCGVLLYCYDWDDWPGNSPCAYAHGLILAAKPDTAHALRALFLREQLTNRYD